MSKPEWGAKRVCQSCAAKFYDFGRRPIVCPKCSAVFDPETLLKSRRSRPAAAAKPSKPIAAAKPVVSDKDEDQDDAGVLAKNDDLADLPDDDDEDDDSVIEDASELGEDDEEVSKVVNPGKDEED